MEGRRKVLAIEQPSMWCIPYGENRRGTNLAAADFALAKVIEILVQTGGEARGTGSPVRKELLEVFRISAMLGIVDNADDLPLRA